MRKEQKEGIMVGLGEGDGEKFREIFFFFFMLMTCCNMQMNDAELWL